MLFILCALFMEELNYKTTSVRNAMFLSTLLMLGVAQRLKKKKRRDSIEERLLLCCYCFQFISWILGIMSHTCVEHPLLINIEAVLVYTVE